MLIQFNRICVCGLQIWQYLPPQLYFLTESLPYINYQMSLYQVQSILDRRYHPKLRRFEYKVKWVGYPEEEATWQPKHNLTTVRQMLIQFDQTHGPKGNNSCIRGEQKQKEVVMAIGELEENLSASVSQYVRSNKQQSYGLSSQSARVKFKSKGIKKNKSMGKMNKPIQGRSQIFNESDNKQQKLVQSQDIPSAKVGNEVVHQSINHSCVQQSEHVPHQSNSKIDQLQQPEQSLQEVLDIEVQQQQNSADKRLVIKQICRRNQEFLYLVQEDGQVRWASKKEILRQHPLSLIEFYQSRIKYYPMNKQQARIGRKPMPL